MIYSLVQNKRVAEHIICCSSLGVLMECETWFAWHFPTRRISV